MIVVALPKTRARHHNLFEIVGRFGLWLSLILFWVQTVVLAQAPLLSTPQFWVLVLITLSTALPWLKLKKVPVKVDSPSSHVALAQFDYGMTPFAGSSIDISHRPLLEWHSFANLPSPQKSGFRLVISRAGDWTGAFIKDKPSHIWVKGIPTAGVANVETIFKRVVWVATGSGIGPCLPRLLANSVPSSLVWSTRNPRKTYGDALVDEILKAQPDALIWDTDKHGKPDLAKLAYQAWQDFDVRGRYLYCKQKDYLARSLRARKPRRSCSWAYMRLLSRLLSSSAGDRRLNIKILDVFSPVRIVRSAISRLISPARPAPPVTVRIRPPPASSSVLACTAVVIFILFLKLCIIFATCS